MNPAPSPAAAPAAIRLATIPNDATVAPTAQFALELRPEQDATTVAASAQLALADLRAQVTPLSNLERRILVLELPGRVFTGDAAAAFAAGHAIAEDLDLVAAEPDLPTAFFPEQTPSPGPGPFSEEGLGELLGCFGPPEPALDGDPTWALSRLRVQLAWARSDAGGRPSRGDRIIVAQPDTGVTPHAELAGAATVAGFDAIDDDPDPTDPLDGFDPGHGTGTASVLISPPSRIVVGSAPRATLMPIRAVRSVIRITQLSVARSIDWAVDHGAQVITMSLGGLPATALHNAIVRAVAADVIVLAAAGNCVRTVVWPARYDECIAVAGTDAVDGQWKGTCRGPAVDISAPAQNVLRAAVPRGAMPGGADVGQGQGTSFAVALTAGVAALWLAHHGRATLIAEARARGETLQAMFRRLLQASSRRPVPWDPFEMGPGIVDADALLGADLGLGLDRESAEGPADPRASATISIASLVAEDTGPEAAVDDELDWHRFGPEIAYALLDARLAGPPPERGAPRPESVPPAVSTRLAEAVSNPALRDRLGLDTDLPAEVGSTGSHR